MEFTDKQKELIKNFAAQAEEDLKNLNELIKSTSKVAVENANNLWKEELKDFDIVHKEYSKANKDTITSPKFIERKVNKKLSFN